MHTPDYLAGRLAAGQRFTLEPLRKTLERLGHPERAVPVVLIGGTNGKGSTQAFLASILARAGYRVGTFTSPSLSDFHELIGIEGASIAPVVARPWAEEVLAAAGPEGLTLFEAATALAFLAFSRSSLDVAVVEVGMGGRLDATNLSEPLVSIVTQVAMDHARELGGTIEAIAREKAAIARPGRSLITGAEGRALEVIREVAGAVGARVEAVAAGDFDAEEARPGPLPPGPAGPLSLGLAGPHQRGNAALAVAAVKALSAAGFVIPDTAVREGLATAYLPGRLEWMTGPDGLRVLVDGAHNPHGAAALARSLEALALPGSVELRPVPRPRHLALAVYADKDVEGMVAALLPAIDRLICTRTAQARCLEPDALAVRARTVAGAAFAIRTASSVADAVESFRLEPGAAHLVTGSLSVVAEARRAVDSPRPAVLSG
jgi:dihydrofolate synthase/folylpolyglutamate synthase